MFFSSFHRVVRLSIYPCVDPLQAKEVSGIKSYPNLREACWSEKQISYKLLIVEKKSFSLEHSETELLPSHLLK